MVDTRIRGCPTSVGTLPLEEPHIPCAVYKIEVDEETYLKAKGEVEQMLKNADYYRFNILGLWLCGVKGDIMVACTIAASAPVLLARPMNSYDKKICDILTSNPSSDKTPQNYLSQIPLFSHNAFQ